MWFLCILIYLQIIFWSIIFLVCYYFDCLDTSWFCARHSSSWNAGRVSVNSSKLGHLGIYTGSGEPTPPLNPSHSKNDLEPFPPMMGRWEGVFLFKNKWIHNSSSSSISLMGFSLYICDSFCYFIVLLWRKSFLPSFVMWKHIFTPSSKEATIFADF